MAAEKKPERRARLLKVTVQAVFAVDDGEGLEEFTGPIVVVPGARWPEFVKGAFEADDLAAILARRDEFAAGAPED